MVKRISEQLFNHQLRAGIQNEKDRELYQYAYRMLINKIICYLLIAGFAVFAGIWKEVAAFLVAFIPLRQYAGGYHFKSAKLCLFFSVALMLTAGTVIERSMKNPQFKPYILVWFLSAIFIILLAPVECKNKLLDTMELKVYGFRCRIILFGESAILFLAVILHLNTIASACLVSHIVMACSLILGRAATEWHFFKS